MATAQAAKKKDDALALHIGSDRVDIASDASLLTAAQLNLLAAKTPDKWIKKRQGRGGKTFDYVEINYVVGILNAVFGFNWSIEVLDKTVDTKSGSIIVLVRLTVNFADGKCITKDAFGGSAIKRTQSGDFVDLADDLKAAQSDGIKKAASMLGVAWDVYSGLTKATNGGGGNGEPVAVDDFDSEPCPPPDDDDDGHDPLDDVVTAEDVKISREDAYRTIPLVFSDGKKRMVTKFEALAKFGNIKKAIGDEAYYETLKLAGYKHANEIPEKMVPVAYALLLDRTKK